MEYLYDRTANRSNLSSEAPQILLRNGLTIRQILHIIYGILAFVSILGNSLVFAIITTHRRGKMLQSSNNLLIASMAMMDMMTGITIYATPTFVFPAETYPYPKNPSACEAFCRIIASEYLLFYFGFGSVITVTAIAVERWIAIAKPLSYRKIMTTKRVKIFISILWVFCLFISVDVMIQIKYESNNTIPCQRYDFATRQPGTTIFLLLEVVRLFFPVLLTLVCYADIARRILCPSKVNTLNLTSNRVIGIRYKSKRKVTIMSATAALAFISCWLPNEIYFSLTALNQTIYDQTTIRITKSLIILSSCLSPFIYSATNEEYRKGLRSLLSPLWNSISTICRFRYQNPFPGSKSKSMVISTSAAAL
ncbi:Growth hormone secretagogue receptor type 1 [Trichoplax sp. H2]|nr:Growth hormone secretagogue receptor type 1 [Trichoplax sp. H2]|eukprot:RDD42807.1 Growth hormone secretagogue receptor type 1 [Trichoplax sp. H2]